jgi:hypothetical protein
MTSINCRDCIFVIEEDGDQVGCSVNRIDKISQKEVVQENGHSSFVISRLCNLYRGKDWNAGEADTEKAIKESAVRFGIILNVTNISKQSLNAALETFKSIDYPKDKISVVLSHAIFTDNAVKKKRLVAKLRLGLSSQNYDSVILEAVDGGSQEVDSIRLSHKSMYLTIINPEDKIKNSDFHAINNRVNADYKPVALAISEDNVVFSLTAYVNLNYIRFGSYQKTVSELYKESEPTETLIKI